MHLSVCRLIDGAMCSCLHSYEDYSGGLFDSTHTRHCAGFLLACIQTVNSMMLVGHWWDTQTQIMRINEKT